MTAIHFYYYILSTEIYNFFITTVNQLLGVEPVNNNITSIYYEKVQNKMYVMHRL